MIYGKLDVVHVEDNDALFKIKGMHELGETLGNTLGSVDPDSPNFYAGIRDSANRDGKNQYTYVAMGRVSIDDGEAALIDALAVRDIPESQELSKIILSELELIARLRGIDTITAFPPSLGSIALLQDSKYNTAQTLDGNITVMSKKFQNDPIAS